MFDEERRDNGGGAAMFGGEHGMRRVAHVDRGATAGSGGRGGDGAADEVSGADWRVIDRALRSCARRRAALDAEEARWLVAAERIEIHRQVACGSIHEYLERMLGYGPRVARERLRVARALNELPAMTAALAAGELCHSAVRELTRVATTTMALYREATRRLEDETGESLTDDQVLDAMCRFVLDGEPRDQPGAVERTERAAHVDHRDRRGNDAAHVDQGAEESGGGEEVARVGAGAEADRDREDVVRAGPSAEEDGDREDVVRVGPDAEERGDRDDVAVEGHRENRPPYQIAITTCASCKRGWHDAAGRSFALPATAVAQVWCDAQVIGRVDGDAPARATRTIPPAIRRQVLRRDRGHCIVPGCRAARHLQIHHVVPRAVGGTHDPRFLGTLCTAHHAAVHDGRIVISGQAPAFVIDRRPRSSRGTRYAEASAPVPAVEDSRARDRVRAHVGGESTAPIASQRRDLDDGPATSVSDAGRVGRAARHEPRGPGRSQLMDRRR